MRASIITPTLNSVKYIETCIQNVKTQGSSVLEHIIVDGGSLDGTVERIMELREVDPSIKLVPGPDRGQSDALNKGVLLSKGEVIGVLNVDDTYEPRAVEMACAILNNVLPPAFVAGNCRIAEGSSYKWNIPKDLRFEALLLGYDYVQWPNNPSAYFYHKSLHDTVGYYDVDDHYSMDLDFVFRVARLATTKYVNQHWGNFNVHEGCKTFEDTQGKIRQDTLLERFRLELTSEQRSTMARIKNHRTRVMAVKGYLKRVPVLRKIMEIARPK